MRKLATYFLVPLMLFLFISRAFAGLNDDLIKAAKKGDLQTVKELVSKGADVNSKNKNGWTPLHTAAYGGRLEIVKYLISKGADIDARDRNGVTPLHWAAAGGRLGVVKYLVFKGEGIRMG